jgi:hypothetical protein
MPCTLQQQAPCTAALGTPHPTTLAALLLQEGKGVEAAERFERLRQTVDELGEGEEAAELIRQSYQGVRARWPAC